MTHPLFLPPGEDIFHPKPALRDAVAAWSRVGAIRRRPLSAARAAEPPAEADPAPIFREGTGPQRQPARLSNPRFDASDGVIGGTVAVRVEAEIPDPDSPRRVLLELFAVSADGRRQRIQGLDRPVPRAGRAEGELTLHPPDFRDESGGPVSRCDYVFTATHPDAKPVESPVLPAEAPPENPFAGLLYYSPARDEYLVFDTEGEAAPMLAEMERLESLRERSRLAWSDPDVPRRTRELQRVAGEAGVLFDGDSQGRAHSGVEELLLVDNQTKMGAVKGWSYLPAPAGGSGQAWKYGRHRFKRSELQARHVRLLKQGYGRRRSPLFENRCRFRHNLFAPEGRSDQWVDFRSGSSEEGGGQEAFTWSGEAALGRYMYGWDGGEAAFDARRKTLKLGVSGQVGLALFEGRLSGTLHLPGPGGMDILDGLRGVKFREAYLADPSRACLLRFSLNGSLSAFLGGTLQGTLAFPSLCFEGSGEGRQKAEASAAASGFVGGQANAGAKVGVEWSTHPATPFRSLGFLSYEYGVSAGVGGEAGIRIDYQEGRFTFQVSAALAWGLGCRGGFSLEIPVEAGWQVVGHILGCVDFHFVREIMHRAYEAYVAQSVLFALSERQRALAEAEWMRARMGKARSAYGWFRDWLAGQESGFLQMKLRMGRQTGLRTTLIKMAPEALGLAVMAIMESREPADFDDLMLILHSAAGKAGAAASGLPPGHKLEWVLRHASGSEKPDAASPGWKETSLGEGVRRVRGFGEGTGYRDGLGVNHGFLRRFEELLRDQGIRSVTDPGKEGGIP